MPEKDYERLGHLILQFLREEISAAENIELQQRLHESGEARKIFEELTNENNLKNHIDGIYQVKKRRPQYQQIMETVFPEHKIVPMKKSYRAVYSLAAAILVLLLGGVFWFWPGSGKEKTIVSTSQLPERFKNDIAAPQGDNAILILADGSVIVLDSSGEGFLTKQGVATITNTSGELRYTTDGLHTDQVMYNTVSTRNGGQYSVTLSDGSKIWLNAASVLRFPTAFTTNERIVYLSGEAYFDVAKSSNPFKVIINNSENNNERGVVEVLGTHFNIKAYPDEQKAKVTLLEGTVRVGGDAGTKFKTMNPGEQATLTGEEELTISKEVDVEEVMAWKNGLFLLRNSEIAEIMKNVERWYNVEIVYRDSITGGFSGKISRKEPVSKLLEILEMTDGVRFSIDDKKITVMAP